MRLRFLALLIGGAFTLGACGSSYGPSTPGATQTTVTVFAASSLTQAFTKLGALFESQHPGSKVRFNFAASDTLATQITQGAPADVFAAASTTPMDTVTSASLASGTPQLFVSNKLLIITPKGDPAGLKGPQDLARPGLKLVLAAPGVPAGDYAREVLDNLGIQKEALKNVVSNEVDDKSVVSKVLLGDADAGVVYVTDLTPKLAPKLAVVSIPKKDNVVARYPIVPLKDGPSPMGGRQFVQLVVSVRGEKILHGFGFGPP
jgi:molybdate transport system substrate-binding protein